MYGIFTDYSINILTKYSAEYSAEYSVEYYYWNIPWIFWKDSLKCLTKYSAEYSEEYFQIMFLEYSRNMLGNIPCHILYKFGILFYSTEYMDLIWGIRGIFFGICLEYIFGGIYIFKKNYSSKIPGIFWE